VQSPVPEHEKLVGSRHESPVQHWPFVVQACPGPVQLLLWQVPTVAPAGMVHANPVQQSAVLVHW